MKMRNIQDGIYRNIKISWSRTHGLGFLVREKLITDSY